MEAESLRHKGRLEWWLETLGAFGLLMVVAGVVAFALSVLIVRRGRGAMAGAALALIVPMPLAIGLYAALRGATFPFGLNSDGRLTAGIISERVSECLMLPMVGMFLTIPAFLVALIGLIVRSLRDDSPRPPALPPR